MSESLQDMGNQLIDAGEIILRRDARSALDEQDYNMAVRRAQEAVELALKGALKMLGADYPRVHDPAPVFADQARLKLSEVRLEILEQIEEISLWLTQARAPSFYFERSYSQEDAQRAFEDATFVMGEIKEIVKLIG